MEHSGTKPRVFISYSHDTDAHKKHVLRLSERLREDGIETRLDQYVKGTPKEKWPLWMLDQIDWAEFILLVCTETYYRRFRGHEETGKGKGVDWEGAVITQEIYNARGATIKFVPVLFGATDERVIPEPVRGHTFYVLNSEEAYQALYDFLLGQAGVEPARVGEPRRKSRGRSDPLAFGEKGNGGAGEGAGRNDDQGSQAASSRVQHNQTNRGPSEVGNQPESEAENQARAVPQGPNIRWDGESDPAPTQGKGNDNNSGKTQQETILTRATGGKQTIALIALCLVSAAALGWKYCQESQEKKKAAAVSYGTPCARAEDSGGSGESAFLLLAGSGTVMETLADKKLLNKASHKPGERSTELYSFDTEANNVYSVDVGSVGGLNLLFLASQRDQPIMQTVPLLAAVTHRITKNWTEIPELQGLLSGKGSYFRIQIAETKLVMHAKERSCAQVEPCECVRKCLDDPKSKCILLVPGLASGTLRSIINEFDGQKKNLNCVNSAKRIRECLLQNEKNRADGADKSCGRIRFRDIRDNCPRSPSWVSLANEQLVADAVKKNKDCKLEKGDFTTASFGQVGLYLYGNYPTDCKTGCKMEAKICAYMKSIYNALDARTAKDYMFGPPEKCTFKAPPKDDNDVQVKWVDAADGIWE